MARYKCYVLKNGNSATQYSDRQHGLQLAVGCWKTVSLLALPMSRIQVSMMLPGLILCGAFMSGHIH
jgi:hypothetical protein